MRDVYLYCGTGGNIRCRKGWPCATWAEGHILIPVSLEDSANGSVARPLARPPWLASARASAGQGYFINTTL